MAIIVSTRVTRDEAEGYFEYAGYRARNLRNPLVRTGHAISHFVNVNFGTQGALVGGWAPLNPRYERWKNKNAPGRPLLVLSGQMRSRAISSRAWTVRGRVLTYHPTRYKRDVDLVDIHMTGRPPTGKKGSTGMPARPLFEITPSFRDEVEDIFRDWLDTLRTRNVRRGPLGAEPTPAAPELISLY